MRFSGRGFVGTGLAVLAATLFFVVVNGNGKGSSETSRSAPASLKKQQLDIAISKVAAARVGIAYKLLPDTSSPGHHTLTFTAQNLPPWARLDASTGTISGTPRTADIGEHSDIIITVADGAHRIATQPFSISVVLSGRGVATLQWRRPDSKVDGSPLDDLAGYRISYGRDPDDLDHSVFISDPDETSYEFSTLEEGMWYFAVIGVNANGVEGPPTVTAQKAI